jgi:hypothetical protein
VGTGESQDVALLNIPFSLQKRARHIVGRQWVLKRVREWLQAGPERCFLLTGAPGSGKSTIAAWLAMPPLESADDDPLELVRAAWAARHFCMASGDGSVDPRRFTQLIANQLASRYDEFALAVAPSVGPQYNVRLHVRENWGKAVAVQIQNLFVTGATVADVFSTAVSQPLFAVAQRRPGTRIPILVDGLDEAVISTVPNILGLLTSEADLPDNVRLFVTSRNERRVVDRFLERADGCRRLDLSAPEATAYNNSDLRAYVVGRVSSEPVARQLSGTDAIEATADHIVRRSAANFLYARTLLDEVAAGRRELTDLAGLPSGLDALYRAYLHRLMPDIDQYGHSSVWLERYRPLLGSLCAAVAPVPLAVLAGWLGRDRGELIATLDDLQQMVRFEPDADGFQLYHASMADFLAADQSENLDSNFFYVSPAEQHDRIVTFYLDRADRHGWAGCDAYGLAHLPRHLALWLGGAEDRASRLRRAGSMYALVADPRFMAAQMDRFGRTQVTAAGFRTALETARAEQHIDATDRLLNVLVGSTSREMRGVCVEGLVSLHPQAPDYVTAKIRHLLSARSEDAWRVGLKAAYLIGPAAKGIFRWIALKGSLRLRQAAEYALYLRWTPEPGNFTTELLDDLSRQVSLLKPMRSRRILQFVTNLSITIYINHCGDQAVGQHTSDLWYRVIARGRYLSVLRHPWLDRLIGMVVSRMFGRRILEGALSSDFQDPMRFFGAAKTDKALFTRVIPYVDPTVDMADAVDDLAQLLRSDITLFRNLAQVVIAVHAYAHPEQAEPVVRQLAARLDPIGRLWLLLAFSVLLPDAPHEWIGLLEALTADFLAADPEGVLPGAGLPSGFDVPLLPLGLAYGKADGVMPGVVTWLRESLSRGDYGRVGHLITWLAPVALYYPQSAFRALREAGVPLTDERLRGTVIAALAVVRTLHSDHVDDFLERADAGHLVPQVSARSDIELVRRYIALIGYYNNVVHQTLHYPRMRYGLLIPCLTELVEAERPTEFIRRFTPISLSMLRTADYQLINWTLPL